MKTIYFITGASGVGKTTLIEQLKDKYANTDWLFFHFDSIEVPSLEEMTEKFGSPAQWQEINTHQWIEKLINKYDAEVIFIEGQVNLQFIKDGFAKHNFSNYHIVLIDCNDETMDKRLHQRGQPELLTNDMKNWLSFLRNQANDLNIPIIDTSNLTPVQTLKNLEALMKAKQSL